MPIHDWTRVDAGIFHHFHHEWISALSRALNSGILPSDLYALAEQLAGGYGPDVLTLEAPIQSSGELDESNVGVALAKVQPKVSFHASAEDDFYAAKANRIAVRHISGHRVIAVIEIVSPGNKSTRAALATFVEKAVDLLRRGVHLMVLDLFPPTPRDPQGIHGAIWEELSASQFSLPPDRPLTLASYIGGARKQAFVEPVAIGQSLPDMPLFLTANNYVPVSLESAYESAWEDVPLIWRKVLEAAKAD